MFFKSFIKVLLLVGGVLWVSPAFAGSIFLGEKIINGDFQTNKGKSEMGYWDLSTGVAGRLSTNTLNTSGGNAGFDGFFNSAFAALGVGVNAGISSISQTFDLASFIDGHRIKTYDLEISFSTVFDGRDYNSATTIDPLPDIFSAYLVSDNGISIQLFSQDSLNFPGALVESPENNQLVNNPSNDFLLSGLAPGSYTLTFSLFEAAGTGTGAKGRWTNTTAGIDNVSVMATAIPNPEPSTLLLLGGGLVALVPLIRRRNKTK